MHLAVGELPKQVAVNGAEGQLAAFSALPSALDVLEDPAYLGCRKIRIDQQARACVEHVFQAARFQLSAKACSPPVLPDNRLVDRLTGEFVPHQRRLALIGDPDGDDGIQINAAGSYYVLARVQHREPEILRIMFDPAITREMLGEFLLADGMNTSGIVEQNRP